MTYSLKKIIPHPPTVDSALERHERWSIIIPAAPAPVSQGSRSSFGASRPAEQFTEEIHQDRGGEASGFGSSSSLKMDMACMPILQAGVYRFDASATAKSQAAPSLSFADPKLREVPFFGGNSSSLTKDPTFVPEFVSNNGQQIVLFKLPSGTSFYGTGEVGGALERTGKRIFTWNTDAWGYNENTTSLYQSHPWVFAILPNGEAFGVLADTSCRCEVDLRKSSTIRFAAVLSFPVLTFGPFPSPDSLSTALGHAIGTIPLPPKWALGYHQCRWSYEPAARVVEIAKTFREKKIPCDVIWMDIDYMDNFRCFTFHPENFPDGKALAQTLHDSGFKGVWMLDPGIKYEEKEGYEAYDTGCEKDVWVQTADGKPYVGECWPGPVVFPDFTQSKVRTWWAELVKEFVGNDIDGIWNDMNEPAVFKTVSKTMPELNIHQGDEDLGGPQLHSYYHNVYGMLQARSTFEGMLLANPSKRPFVLTRAGFLGSHRYAATWTGDNLATWDHLKMSIPMAINLGLSGQPFAGPDIGGFAGNATPKLFARWMGIGSMMPFSRGHSEKATSDQEPWSFGPEVEEICRKALYRRYRLLPHFYTLFHRAHSTGLPVMAPLFFADPKDPKLRKIEDSFLLGPLLVSACLTPKKHAQMKAPILPNGIWHRFSFNDDSPELPLLYLKGGSILATGPVAHYVGERTGVDDPLTLIVVLDQYGKAKGDVYEDDEEGFSFQKGEFLHTHYEAELIPAHTGITEGGGEVVLKVASVDGKWKRRNRSLIVRLLVGDVAEVEGKGVDGEEVRVRFPTAAEILDLIETGRKQEILNLETAGELEDEVEEQEALKGTGVVKVPIDLDQGNVLLKVVPWIGGRIISMVHKPSGYEWLAGRLESSGYEEYSGTEFRSAGCTEEYKISKREMSQMEGQDALCLEGDISGGLALFREIILPQNSPDTVQISSKIVAKSVGAGSGGFSRLVCLRIHPVFKLDHPMATVIKYTAIDGTSHEISPNTDCQELWLRGSESPNGEWMLHDTETDLSLINRFKVDEVDACLIHWGPCSCNLELFSPERPVSKDTPLTISHEYEMVDLSHN
ncbi:hypothetical protein BDL97_03G038000 [Sphagnum fallax]|nr:hypothetical protein BDL97_03G038000 [Sphagnum fallax]